MGFGESIKTCLSKYATFSGRASRSEFWWFYLFLCCLSILSTMLDHVFGTEIDLGYDPNTGLPYNIYGYGQVYSLFFVGTFLPSYAVLARRLHDIGKSGWNFFWVFTLIGAFFLLYWLCKSSDGDNAYGPSTNPGQSTAPQGPSGARNDPFAEIERLGTMMERGLITAEEFAAQKKRLLQN